MQFTVTAYVNVSPDNFFGLKPRDCVAMVGRYVIKADSPNQAAGGMFFTVGNRTGCDIHGQEWPSDVRSLSVGDLLKVETPVCNDHPRGAVTFLAVAAVGWTELPEPTQTKVPIEGTSATSRV